MTRGMELFGTRHKTLFATLWMAMHSEMPLDLVCAVLMAGGLSQVPFSPARWMYVVSMFSCTIPNLSSRDCP